MVFTTSRLMLLLLPVLVLLLLVSTAMVMVVADEREGSIQRSSSLLRRRIISQRNDRAINDERRSSSISSISNPNLFVLEGNTTCDLYLKDIEYETITRRSKEEWVCELSQEDSLRIGNGGNYGSMIRYVDIIVDSDSDSDIHSDSHSDSNSDRLLLSASSSTSSFISAISGVSSMTISGEAIIIDIDEDKMYIPHDATIEIISHHPNTTTTTTTNLRHRHHRRGLAAKDGGVLRTVVIRVTDSEGISPQASREKLINDFYSNETISLKSQYESCSYGKLLIEPFAGKTKSKGKMIMDGIVDIKVDYNIFDTTATNGGGGGGNRNKLQRAAFDTAFEEIGDLRSDDDFDLILFCFPFGTGTYV
jgi:hypothetical protein